MTDQEVHALHSRMLRVLASVKSPEQYAKIVRLVDMALGLPLRDSSDRWVVVRRRNPAKYRRLMKAQVKEQPVVTQ